MSLLPSSLSLRCAKRLASYTQTVRYASVLAHNNPYAQHSFHRQHTGQKRVVSPPSTTTTNKKHDPRTTPVAAVSSATETSTLQASSVQQQQQQQQQQHRSISTAGNGRVWPIIFRHTGPMPPAPQAIDQMQFILGLKPLNMNVPMPQMSRGGSAEVHTAAEARQKATQQLESLNTIVQNASGILVALSRAAERHIQNKQASVAARNSSVAVQVLGSRQVQKGDATQQATQSDESIKANNNKRAMLLAMFLSGSGVGVCVGSVLLSANIF